jgi:hypothetical protein
LRRRHALEEDGAMLAGLLAAVAAGLFAGAAVYINLVEHPARRQTGVRAALAEFAPSYHRAAVTQVALALVGCGGAVGAWRAQADARGLLGGGLLGAVIPCTAVGIRPTNRRLLDPATARDPARAAALLSRWGWLHAVRSVLSLLALLTFVRLLSRGRGEPRGGGAVSDRFTARLAPRS